MSKISVIGAGYVGLVTAACFAELGHQVNLLEIDPEKVKALQSGVLPINESGLPEIWHRNWARGRLLVTNDYVQGFSDSEFAFIAVGTPATTNGKPNLKWVCSAAKSVAQAATRPLIVVIRSTVLVGTAEMVAKIIARHTKNKDSLPVVSNPEFLREGLAVFDFMHPSRIVIGAADANAAQAVAQLWQPFDCPIIFCDNRTSEMIKYTANAFLATKISFINEIASLCDKLGVDVKEVARTVGMDKRIGSSFLEAGLGWGGSCLPKDTRALIHMADSHGITSSLLRSVIRVNQEQPRRAVKKLQKRLGSLGGKTIGILGLAFKPNSDDMREASSLSIIALLKRQGCQIRAYDPLAMKASARLMPDVCYCSDAYEVAEDSDALILVTEWDEFKELDLPRLRSLMKSPVLLDGRNLYDPEKVMQAGFVYEGMGRSAIGPKKPEVTLIGSKEK
jgi:UDPglucose 6-dehydrogenase